MNIAKKENQLKRQVRPWAGKFARFGFIAKGVLYAAVGFLALKYVLRLGGGTVNSKETISAISKQPFGEMLIMVIALGFASYAIWRYVEAIADVENHGRDFKGWMKRLGCIFSGSVYAGLAFWTVMFFLGQASSGSEVSEGKVLLKHAWGRGIIGAIGIFYIGMGIEHLRSVVMRDFKKEVDDYKIDRNRKSLALWIAAVGISARGIVFLIIGWFISKAAIFYDSSQFIGLGGALDKLLEHRYGRGLLGIVAVGLMVYGLYCFVRARYHQFNKMTK